VGGFTQRNATTAVTVSRPQATTASSTARPSRAQNPLRRRFATGLRRWARSTLRSGADQPAGVTRRALVTSIGVTGTSWCPPLLPVFVAAILSTTSMPSTTWPNTA
jgi:hypothetical protein